MSLILILIATLSLVAPTRADTDALSYSGKTVLVTGSTDGLGRELALALAADGANVIVHGRNAERGAELVDEISAAGQGSARFYAADFDDVMLAQPGAARHGYGQSKLAQVSMTIELAPAFAEQGITMISLHPATLMNTTMVEGLGIPPRTTVEQGRDHVMGLIRSPTLEAGAFHVDGKATSPNDPQPLDPEARARLVALSADLSGVPAE